MKVNTRIELEFAGVTLPIVKDADGREAVPLKPISDVFGLKWEEQRKKIILENGTCTPDSRGAGAEKQPVSDTPLPEKKGKNAYLGRLLGASVLPVSFAGQVRDMLCIRLDRVETWILQVNPDRVRAAGNETGADFIEQKHHEWADLIHAYETREGGMMQAVSAETRETAINIRLYLSVLRAKRDTTDEHDRKALGSMAESLAVKAGAPYQRDLIES